MAIILLRCLVLYFVVILAVRIMGKRQIGELQPSELVVTILISELAAMPMQDLHLPIMGGIIPIFTLVALELLISVITLRSVKARRFLYGQPLILIYNGQFRQKEMERARVTIDDIMEIMRNNGISQIEDVQYAVLETNGQLSVIQNNISRPVCLQDLKMEPPRESGLPHMIIMDGHVIEESLRECSLSPKWLKKELKNQKISSPRDVFLMTVDDCNKVFLVPKQ